MRNNWKLRVAVVGCEMVGLLATPVTIRAIPTWYAHLNKPFFSPPNYVFGPVWMILYFLMGLSLYLVWQKGTKNKEVRAAMTIFGLQLALNLLWSLIFFWRTCSIFGVYRDYYPLGNNCSDDGEIF